MPKNNLFRWGARMNSQTAQLTENGTELVPLFARFALGASFYPLWLIVLAYGGHMEQRTYPGEISLISWNIQAQWCLSSRVHGRCRLLGQLPSRRHSLGYCSSQASKHEWPPSCLAFSFCHLLLAWSQVLASRHHSTIRFSRRPLRHSYWRSGSLTDSRWTSF